MFSLCKTQFWTQLLQQWRNLWYFLPTHSPPPVTIWKSWIVKLWWWSKVIVGGEIITIFQWPVLQINMPYWPALWFDKLFYFCPSLGPQNFPFSFPTLPLTSENVICHMEEGVEGGIAISFSSIYKSKFSNAHCFYLPKVNALYSFKYTFLERPVVSLKQEARFYI